MSVTECDALVVGAGPAGLMAADVISAAGFSVVIADAMPSPARKFLMAGKSGLNITKDEPLEAVLAAYGDVPEVLASALHDFGPNEVKDWAQALGQEVFSGSSRRVFPKAMKASPLLRAWLARLGQQGAELRRNWRLESLSNIAGFTTPEGRQNIRSKTTILAFGGASWARLGSNGEWISLFDKDLIEPFLPSNVGLIRKWSDHMQPYFGKAIKGVALKAGAYTSRGEFVITKNGLEGGGIYSVTRGIREGAPLAVNLLPDWTNDRIKSTLKQRKNKETTSKFLSRAFRLPPEKRALLMELARPLPDDLEPVLTDLKIGNVSLRPIDEAISTAGGLSFDGLSSDLEIKTMPGCFAAGEMLDWDAPTGGYLLTACLATGRRAGLGALTVLRASIDE